MIFTCNTFYLSKAMMNLTHAYLFAVPPELGPAKVAVYIQRTVLRRIIRRRGRSAVRPKSLDDFCRVVRWEDIVSTVRDVLIKDEKLAIISII